MDEVTKKHESATLERFRCEKRLADAESSMVSVIQNHFPMLGENNNEYDYEKVIPYLFAFKKEQEELLKNLKTCIAKYCDAYNIHIKSFLDMNVAIQGSVETQKLFRSYEKTLHPSHYFFKIVTKKVDIQYQKALLGMTALQQGQQKDLIWSFRTRMSVMLSMLLQKYPNLKFEFMRVADFLMVDIKFNVPFFFLAFIGNHVYAYFIEKSKNEAIEDPNLMNFGIRHRIASAVLEDHKTSEELFYHQAVADFFEQVDPYWSSPRLLIPADAPPSRSVDQVKVN